jgi:hypothetical protein
MACAYGGALPHIYGNPNNILPLIDRILADAWDSSGLPQDNAFTATLVIRGIGVLRTTNWVPNDIGNRKLDSHAGELYRGQSLADVATNLATGAPASLRVTNYPPRTEIGYWLAHGATCMGVSLGDNAASLADWAQIELRRQTTFIASGNHAKVDPISLAMAACLLRRIENGVANEGIPERLHEIEFPEAPELQHAILTFFTYQRDSLLWDRYFPMFNYPDPESGANHCWAFEVLEAILTEFPYLINNRDVFNGLQKAVTWCEESRIRYIYRGSTYTGWNGGGQELTLSRGMPEAWAVGVVHICLARIIEATSASIEKLLIAQYSETRFIVGHPDRRLWDSLLDSELELGGVPSSLKKTIERYIIDPAYNNTGNHTRFAKSALLFGPPGTAKTTIAKATAHRLAWPLIELTPSNFLDQGLENIYQRSAILFEEMMDLRDVVILFDEIDAFVQRRGFGDSTPRLDAVRQFLTTSMLPKLGRLRLQGHCIFFLATNHRLEFDEAITRAGRFDLLLHVGPPPWREKVAHFSAFLPITEDANATQAIEYIEKAIGGKDTELRSILELSTFSEFRSFIEELSESGSLIEQLRILGTVGIRNRAKLWCKKYLMLRSVLDGDTVNPLRIEYNADRGASRIQN